MRDAFSVLFGLQVLISQGRYLFQIHITCDFTIPRLAECVLVPVRSAKPNKNPHRGAFKPHGLPQIFLTTNMAHRTQLQAI